MSTQHDASLGLQHKQAKHNKNLVRRFYRDAWEQGHLGSISELFAFKHITHDTASGPVALNGAEAVKQLLKTFRQAIPDMQVTVESMLAERDTVAVRYTIQGVQTGEFRGVPPSHTAVTLSGMAIHKVIDDKIVESWFTHTILSALVPA